MEPVVKKNDLFWEINRIMPEKLPISNPFSIKDLENCIMRSAENGLDMRTIPPHSPHESDESPEESQPHS